MRIIKGMRQATVLQNKRQIRKQDIFIGLDFGTTFTKAAYSMSGSNYIYTITFDNDDSYEFNGDSFYLPSVLYKDFNNRIFINNGNDREKIKYFKYKMINSVLVNEQTNDDIKFVSQLHSIFYLANVIKYIKRIIIQQNDISSPVEWYLNMGVPISNYADNKQDSNIYDKVLNIAYKLSENDDLKDYIDFDELKKFYIENESVKNYNLSTVPELYAECLLCQLDSSIKEGLYGIVDIGGGTIDIATFYKYQDIDESYKVDCISQVVKPLGYEALISKIVNNPSDINSEVEKEIKQLLENKENIHKFNGDDLHEVINNEYINTHLLMFNRRNLRTAYGDCFTSANDNIKSELKEQMNNGQPINYFIAGGAKNVTFYNSVIEHMMIAHSKIDQIPKLEAIDLTSLINSATSENGQNKNIMKILDYKNDRLIVSQMLAQSIQEIPQINFWPWNFQKEELHESSLKDEIEEKRDNLKM